MKQDISADGSVSLIRKEKHLLCWIL